jgi:ABC-type dipeptide/oligopeptide/nickel transport system permease component
VTERVFAWPGIGQRIVEAILARDYPGGAGRRARHGVAVHADQLPSI